MPVAVAGGHTFASVSVGTATHTCGLTTTGAAYCWGNHSAGQLGNGSFSGQSTSPSAVLGGLTFAAIDAGAVNSCAISEAGQGFCWGLHGPMIAGLLGDGLWTSQAAPLAVSNGLTFASITVGDSHACAVTTTDVAYCWGFGTSGQLGDGATLDRTAPTPVAGGLTFSTVSAGSLASCGLATTGKLYCWGNGASGQIGNGSTASQPSPVPVAAFP